MDLFRTRSWAVFATASRTAVWLLAWVGSSAALAQDGTAPAEPPSAVVIGEAPQHDLMGSWTLHWLETGNKNAVAVRSVEVKNGYTDILQASVMSGQENCSMIATIWDRATAVLPMPGPPRKADMQLALPSFSVLQIDCAELSVQITAFGSPGRRSALNGRALTTFKKTGQVLIESVLLGREP